VEGRNSNQACPRFLQQEFDETDVETAVSRRREMMKSRRILLVSFLLVMATAIAANAQSIDRDNPTPLTSGKIEGAGGDQKTVYYYSFEAGPGNVSATLAAKTKKGAKSAAVGIELFDVNARSLTSTLLNEGLGGGKEKLDQVLSNGLGRLTSGLDSLTGDTRRKSSRVNLKAKQTLTLRLTVGPGIETYTVKLDGAVEFGEAATASDPAQPNPPATELNATDATVPPTEQQPPPTEHPPAEQAPPAANPKPPIVKIPGKSSQKPAIIKIPGRKPPQ
jgi:hypothetical protein